MIERGVDVKQGIDNGSTMDWQWSQTEKRKSSWQNGPAMYFAQCRTPIQSPVQRKITTNLFSRKSKFVFPNSSLADPAVLACSNPQQLHCRHSATHPTHQPTQPARARLSAAARAGDPQPITNNLQPRKHNQQAQEPRTTTHNLE